RASLALHHLTPGAAAYCRGGDPGASQRHGQLWHPRALGYSSPVHDAADLDLQAGRVPFDQLFRPERLFGLALWLAGPRGALGPVEDRTPRGAKRARRHRRKRDNLPPWTLATPGSSTAF